MRLHGLDLSAAAPSTRARAGLGRSFQDARLFAGLTVAETISVSLERWIQGGDLLSGAFRLPAGQLVEAAVAARVDELIGLFGLGAFRDKRVGGQSYGTLKLLELGCALATDPDILLLDEPTSGMGPEESDELGERLLDLRKEFGLTMLVIEHHVPLVLRVCDHVYVLNFGRLLAQGTPPEVQSHPEVIAAYLGGEAPEALAATEEPAQDVAAEVAPRKRAAKKATS